MCLKLPWNFDIFSSAYRRTAVEGRVISETGGDGTEMVGATQLSRIGQ